MGNSSCTTKCACGSSGPHTDHRYCSSDAAADYHSSSFRLNTEPYGHSREDNLKLNRSIQNMYSSSFHESPCKENLGIASQDRDKSFTHTPSGPRHKHQSSSFILGVQNSFEEQDQTVLLEGELFRLQPGDKPKLISRWCKLTKSQFCYYRNRISCLRGDKPLLVVSVNSFDRVNQVLIPEVKDYFLFEIFSNGLFDELDFSNMTRGTPSISPLRPALSDRSKGFSSIEKCHSVKKLSYLYENEHSGKKNLQRMSITPTKMNNLGRANSISTREMKSGWTNREIQMFEAGDLYVEKRLIFGSPFKTEMSKWMRAINHGISNCS